MPFLPPNQQRQSTEGTSTAETADNNNNDNYNDNDNDDDYYYYKYRVVDGAQIVDGRTQQLDRRRPVEASHAVGGRAESVDDAAADALVRGHQQGFVVVPRLLGRQVRVGDGQLGGARAQRGVAERHVDLQYVLALQRLRGTSMRCR